jgi:hypothetical protein
MGVAFQQLRNPNPLAYPAGVLPGFDPSHVAAKNCVLSAVSAGNNFISLPKGIAGTVNASPSATMKGLIGPATLFSGTNDRVAFPCVTGTMTSCTMACIVNTAFTTTTDAILVSTTTNTAGAGCCFAVQVQAGLATGKLEFFFENVAIATSTLSISNNRSYFLAVSWVSATLINFIAVDLATGVITEATSASGRASQAAGDGIGAIGNELLANNRMAQGSIAAAMIALAPMSIKQLEPMGKEAWKFWYPQGRGYYVGAAARGPPPTGGFTPKFRRTLSQYGSGVGKRQSQAE